MKFGTTVALLSGLNKIKDAKKIYPGQKLQVHPFYTAKSNQVVNSPISSRTEDSSYIVKKDETLSSISLKTGISISELQKSNNIKNKENTM